MSRILQGLNIYDWLKVKEKVSVNKITEISTDSFSQTDWGEILFSSASLLLN